MNTKKNYLYIICNGHSGSTLLEMILGSHSQVFSIGEIKHFSDYYKSEKICCCGSIINECEFWSEICKKMGSINIEFDIKVIFLQEDPTV